MLYPTLFSILLLLLVVVVVVIDDQALCVKLADFGTADLMEETLGQPVGLDQFTTLENTPVDFFVLGDQAQQVSLSVCMFFLYVCL